MRKIETEKPIKLFSDPSYRGADFDFAYVDTLPTTILDLTKTKLEFWETEKIKSDQFRANVADMKTSIQNGFKPPPILVVEKGLFKKSYLVIDGHHRVEAFKQLGVNEIPAKIVPKKDVEITSEVPETT